jgi:putative ABC transport system ATP-binding protein
MDAPSRSADHELAPTLELLVELSGGARDPIAIRAAASAASAVAHDGEDWSAALLHALPSLGLRGAAVIGSATEIARSAGSDRPLVVRGRIDDGRDRTLVLTDRRGQRVRIEDPGTGETWWMAPAKLEASVVPDPAAWIAVDAAMPLAGIAARDGEQGQPTPLQRLAFWMRLDRQDLTAIVIYAIAIGLLGLTTPVAVQALVSTVAFGTVLQPLVMLSIALFVALALSAVFRGIQTWLVEVLQRRLFVRVVADLAHRLPRVRRDALDGAHAPELVNRFFDVFTVQKTASALLLGGLEIALTVIVGLVVLAFYHPLLLALDAMLVLAIAGVVLSRARQGAATAISESKAKYGMAAWIEEIALHHGELKLGGGQRFAAERADALARRYLETRRRHFSVAFQQLAGMLAIQAIASAAVLGVGGWLVIARQLTLGQLVAAEIVVTAVVASLAKVGKYLENAYDLLAGLDKLGQLADLPVEREDGAQCEVDERASLRLARVRASYRGRGGDVLAGVDLAAQPGERIAITGPSGGGKSLLVELIAGIREPRAGRIELGGRDVRDLSLGSLRSRIAAVLRTATVAGTVLDNVRLGRAAIDRGEVRAALATVGLLDEIEVLADGLETVLLPDGAPLSDGQALRLTLARAIASRPALLVVDHVLDGIDDATREPLLDALFDPSAPWTLVVVSADPHVLRRADRVLVLVDGVLVPRDGGGASP